MLNDKTTLKDLSVFTSDAGGGVFGLLKHCTTQVGQEALCKHILNPPDNLPLLQALQNTVRFWTRHTGEWPDIISNGTVVMLENFFEASDHEPPQSGLSAVLGNFLHKLLNRQQYEYAQFSVSHISDFLKGCMQLTELLKHPDLPSLLRAELESVQKELQHRLTGDVVNAGKNASFKTLNNLRYKVRREMKNSVYRLINHYARMDAWRSLAIATTTNGWAFPELVTALPVHFEAKELYHPLLQVPVSYDIVFTEQHNFLLLTGANMSGKTTFMRAMGVAALLAHLGAGVPATTMRLGFLRGIITNMHVEDNLIMGESYFLAEVHRMKDTAEKLLQPAPHLVLMDELFKGTNVHDAYECTRAVVEGLMNRPHHLMVLSTHLYEVAQHFKEQKGVQFAYFVTDLANDGSYRFRYELKQGISNDRIGYRILQKEGVLELLRRPIA